MAVRWRGHKRLRRQAEMNWDFQGSKTVVSFSYVGPYAVCRASAPKHGAELADMAGFHVTNCKVSRQAATIARLSITAESEAASVSVEDNNEPTSTQYEMEWSQIEKPLKQHPMYATGGSKAITDTGWATVQRWEDETEPAIKGAFKYTETPDSTDLIPLPENEKHLCQKLNKGVDSYLLYMPVVRKISNHPRQPHTGNCAITGAPSGFDHLPVRKNEAGDWVDYVWLKTADRATNSGENNTWQRTEEWTGFDKVDADLYPSSV